MKARTVGLLTASTLCLALLSMSYQTAARAASCSDTAAASPTQDGVTASDSQACDVGKVDDPEQSDRAPLPNGPKTKTLNCGPKVYGPHAAWSSDPFCQLVQAACAVPVTNTTAADPKSTTLAFLREDPGGPWVLDAMNCDAVAATAPPPTVTPFDAFAQVTKLVPEPPIGAAPGRGSTLVNIQTIFWVDTSADRDLGTATLLGHRVGLRIHAREVAWDFGDGARDDHADLGRPYTQSDACPTVQCPGFFGHQFVTTGSFTVAATVTWTGQFSVDGGPWRDIANPANGANTVAGQATTSAVRVLQARGVLVPPPD